MKYDAEGRLVLYLERSKPGKALSFIKIRDGNTLLRYDGVGKTKHFTKFYGTCMLAHRFEAEESWVTVVSESHEITGQTVFPDSWFSMAFGPNDRVQTFTMVPRFTAACMGILSRNSAGFDVASSRRAKRLLSWDLDNSMLFIGKPGNAEGNA